jgi:hypothetical protein
MSRIGLIDKLKIRFGQSPADSDTAATNIGGDIYDECDSPSNKLVGADGTPDPAVWVDDDGNVGIGTINPQYLLDTRVTTNKFGFGIFSDIDTPGEWTGLLFGHDSATDYKKGGIIFEGQDTSARGKLHFALEGTAGEANVDIADAKMTIDYNGNVGVGVTPAYKLDVYGNVTTYLARFFNDGNVNTNQGILVQAGADNGVGQTVYFMARDGNGDNIGYLEQTAGSVFQLVDVPSSAKHKRDIHDSEIDAIHIIKNTKTKTYKKENCDIEVNGFLYEDLQETYPEATSVSPEGHEGISYAMLTPVLWKGIEQLVDYYEQLQQQINNQQIMIESQQQQIVSLSKRIEDLEGENEK